MKTDPSEPAPKYLQAVLELARHVQPGQVAAVSVEHDDSCDLWQGRACNCEPRVYLGSPPRTDPRKDKP